MADITNTLQKEFYGDDVRFFLGVVEDNTNDPEMLGRVRVRIFGLHNAYTEDVPTEKLPWATVLVPAVYGGVSGVGRSPNGIEQGSWVFGMFMDGKHSQSPVVLGTIPKKELPSGEDITPEERIRPASIESSIGQAPITSYTGGGRSGGGSYNSVNVGETLLIYDQAMYEGYTPEQAAVISGFNMTRQQGG